MGLLAYHLQGVEPISPGETKEGLAMNIEEIEKELIMDTQTAKSGTILSVSAGEYSDFHYMGFFVVLTDFLPMVELGEFLKEKGLSKDEYGFNKDEFLSWLIKKGLLLEIEIKHSNFDLGDYGRAATCLFNKEGRL